jgi:uncharacterized protein
MSDTHETAFFVWNLFVLLRRRGFPLGMNDYEDLRRALRAGFGLASNYQLRDVCCALWAKSLKEQETLKALFDQTIQLEWNLSALDQTSQEPDETAPFAIEVPPQTASTDPSAPESADPPAKLERREGLPNIPDSARTYSAVPFIFVPQFPLTHREIAQLWRRLRRPFRAGPPIELDIDATIHSRSRSGLLTLTLVPRRRNMTRLLLLVDRRGSMQPFHWFVDHVCAAIQSAIGSDQVVILYFHDVPAKGADRAPLIALSNQLSPQLDQILPQIEPLERGSVYTDTQLLQPRPIATVLRDYAKDSAVIIISDAGAARGRPDTLRLLDTIAFLKALRRYTSGYIWLNPLPEQFWSRGVAAQLQRHVPMFSLERAGMERAVNVLRGRPYPIARQL